MSIIPKQNANLSADEKRALLAQLLREKVNESKSLFPLSHGQQALWFLYKLAPHSWAYNTLFTARILSPVDIPALRRTFQALISRHPSLRATYTERDGKPFQQIHQDVEVQIEEIDASTWNWDELKEQVTQEARRPFNLEQGSILRVSLFTRSPKDHVFMLAIHHIASDFWSLLILMDELRVLYSAEKTGTQASLPPQNLSYVDYVHWQNQMLAGAAEERLWAYWREQLAGELPVLNLPTDRPRLPVQTYQGASHSFRLTEELTQRLKGLAQTEKATLYMTLLAAFEVLLYRYTGQEDILVGSPTFGRTQREFAEIVGYFVNPVVLRANLTGNPTFQAFLSQVRQTVLGAIGHQDYPFPLLVERLQAERDPTRSPIFQVLFILQKPQQFEEVVELFAPSETASQVNWGELKLEPFEIPQQEGQFDLTLEMIEAGESLFGFFKYNTDLFEADTITRMSGHFQTLLEAIVTNPQQRVSQFPLLSEAEQHQLLVEWNDTQVDYPKDLCVHQLFEAQSAQTPEAVAVEFEGQQLTYRELNRRANQVAHHLRSLGVGSDGLVGICMERSLEMVIGLLGILKAGGAYVPLDPSYPQERLAFMLEDAQVPILLTQQQLVEKLPEYQARVVCLDTDSEVLTQQSEENPLSEVMADHLAYVMYTSGSTGRPKGVSVIHRGVVRLVKQTNYVSFSAEEVFLQLAPISFDASTFEIWGSLLNGARLVVMPPHTPSLQELGQAIEQYQVTTLWLTAGLFHLMVDEQIEELKSVRQLLAGGDVLSVAHVKKVLEEITGLRLINGYGPTENTTFTCCYPITEPRLVGISVPIGRPIANTQVYLLDDHLQPVPVGVPGELYIGGDGLARGYLNRPELTAERFILNPFSNEPGARLYKTGDLVCYQPDGNIQFLGRLDDQVKIRGFRIELGEIEAVLSQHPVVQQSVVIVREDIPGNQQLVAYLVPDKEQSRLTVSELRQFLKQELPEYMTPSAFVTLDSLPLTPNGKVDRRALPSLEMARIEVETTLVAPRTPIEEILALIWTDILGVKQVGIHDNFFELGGHSLLATQVISRVRSTLGIELPLRSLFKNPTVLGLAECVETALSVGQSIVAPPLLPIARSVEMPLSFAQARLWFLDQLEPGNAFYNIPAAVRLSGQLNLAALEQSLNQIISRHEALRTNFVTVNGQPVQVIASTLTLTLPIVDLWQLPESERERDCQRLANEEAVQPFDLATEPLVRTKLLKLSESEHVLLLTMHHIVSDGWSMGVLVRELAALYEAFCNDSLLVLPELPIQYPDFAVWQQQWLQAEVLESQLCYWKQQLDGVPALLELPTDRPRPAVQTFRGAHQSFALSKEVTEALITLSQRQGATLFMTLLAAFETLLHRYTGQTDICVGTPIANRNRAEIEGLIGLFVNTLVLRTDMSGNPSFEDVLSKVRDVALEAYAHQDLPFEQLVEALQPSRDLSHTPLFQVMFVLENAPMPSLKLQGLTLSLLEVESATAKFDLTLSLENSEQGLMGSWEYNTDLFDAATITRIAGHYETLLEAIVTNPQQQVSEFPLLSEAERHQLLIDWNDTQVDYLKDVCIHQLFEAQVERTPDAVAVVFEDEQLTYGELNCRANQLAHYLRSLGVSPDDLVGICVERSLEMVIGLLGILKAGGAYVPLDPEYPTERLAYMLSDSQVSVLLTQPKLADSFPEHGAQVVCLEKDWGVISHQSEENPVSSVKSSNLAYTIYTSGSTGKPKGVMISHKAISNHMCWMQTAFPLTDADKVLQKTPFSFDASIWEFYAPLLAGAQLVMARPGGHRDSAYLIEVITELKVTTVQLVPSLLQMLLESEKFKRCKSLKRVFCGGEALPIEYIKRFSRHLDADLHNLYGPTEATIDVTFFTCKRESHQQLVPIGRPIANTQIYILDCYLQPVGVGVAGELYIGGDGLARGYLNRPDLTAEKFISNPFSNQPGSRLYKTGDLARYLPDGNIEYLGRIDNQVKVRGFRIELGEIEAAIAQHPGVRETVVIAREDVPERKYLAAYIVPNHDSAIGTSELRNFLKEKLPDYMIPGAFVVLDVLPLTPNGKIDRRALPEPDTSRPEGEGAYVGPQTPVEELLAGIWAQVLAVKQVSIHDNFFDLGGHSLLATQLISRVRDTFGVEFPLRGLFECPTVASLSERLEVLRRTEQGLVAPPLLPVSREGELLLSFAQARLWFLEQLEPGSSIHNMPAAVRLTGSLDVAALEQSLQKIVLRHETLRTTFGMVSGEPIQVIAPVKALTLPLVDLRSLPEATQEAEVKRLATESAQQPFDLAMGPLLRATLLHLSEAEHVLLLTMHHIVSDGWSIGVLIRELATLYKAFSSGKPSPLPQLPIQYADFAHWQRQWLQSEVLAAQLSYWQQQLTGASALLELPTDRPRPAVQTFRGATELLALPEPLSQKLKTLSQRSGVTLFMTLLAAFQTLLYRYTGQEDICIGSPIANRNRSETEELIGFFVNTLVLRTDMSENPSFQELLGRVREVTLGAYAHQDLPFEQLVEALQPERTLSHHPLFQVMFVLQNAPMSALELPDLTISSLEIESSTAKFDLTLSMEDTEQGLVGLLEYNTDLFDAATISRMREHFQTLLEGIVAEPKQRLSDLPLLTQQERQQLLVEWNDTQVDYPKDVCVHQLFEAQVERTPDAVAVVFEDEQLTYGELNRRANQLAHYLRSLGVSPDDLVGICVERSLEMIVGFLGILKAGGAYVPLDPSYPQERLALMLKDAQVSVLLTQQQLVEKLPEHQARLVCLDTEWEAIARHSKEKPLAEMTPDHLAYVIYTSGSTGQPKGVCISHRAVNRLVLNTNYVKLEPSDRVAQASNCSFDAATFEIWGALLHGARLVGVTRDVALSPKDFAAQLREQGISVLFLTTALFNQLGKEVRSAFNSVRHLLFGGEAVDPRLVKMVLENSPPQRLLHVYGPTESTTFSSWHLVQEVPEGVTTIPIGRPLSNTQIYLLDNQMQPVPVGVPGELYIGGDGLARGYLNRPELTAERFIVNPFSNEPEARLYKTGDQARYLSDGNIEFLGRLDDQVKIRGFRIELGEIEAVLGQHPAVEETVVVAREDVPGNKRLVAYLVVNQAAAPTIPQLQQFLKQQLPEYMVPNAFVLLNALPLTSNGKVDRRALPAPDTSRPFGEGAYVGPQTPIEELLAGIWAQVLEVKEVSIHDNFFDLGGHSLLATQLISRVRDTFGVEFPLRGLFESPTVASLSERLEELLRTEQGMVAPPLLPVSREGELLLSFAQARLWFLEQLEPGSSAYNIPSAVRLTGSLDVAALKQSLNEIVLRHEALRTTFAMVSGEPIQVIAPVKALTLPLVDLRSLPEATQEAEVKRLATESAQQPFDLAMGPLLRATLLHLSEAEHVLLLTMHHIVSDGWSIGVLIRELATLYKAFSSGKPSPLPQLPIQYADFAHWQRQWLQSEVLAAQLSYWQQQLTGASALLELPTDRPRPAVQTFRGATELLALPEPLSQKLKTLSQRSGVTLFMTLLAAFQTLLYRYTGQEDICIGSPIANRNRSETEELIGFFVNTLVLRTDMSENPSFQELLGRVREVTLGAYAHQDLPFEQLVEALQPERTLSHHPLFQVMFVLQNAPMSALELPDLTISSLEIESSTAKFDLTLSMEDTEQGLVGLLEYNTDLFDAATISRMREHFQTLLEGIVAEPKQRLSDLPLLTQQERQQLLVEWNDTQVDYPKDVCVHQLFEAQVERTPDAVAVVFEDEQLTYGELNRRANQLAHYLRSLGVSPDDLVGICVERSLEMIVGFLGILKAGGAYVPLDPSYPQERLALMLKDAQVSVLLTQQQLVEKLPEHQARLVCLDTEWEAIARHSKEKPLAEMTPDHLAYVIYTSGSTGQPKGVCISHRAVNRLVLNTNYVKLEPSDRVAQASNCSFDAATFEIWGALLHGARLVGVTRDVALSPKDFAAQLREQGISVLFLTTALFNQLGKEVRSAFNSVRHLLFGGEAVDPRLVKMVLENSPPQRLLHVYGPTESTTFSSWHLVQEVPEGVTTIPIGRPLSNTQIYLLDNQMQPVPVGVPGELYIGGDGLARGYLNRPELTAERFIVNPFSNEPEARLYKTGDQARYLSDGNIEFLGRLDDQVKIRGFRIELGEIEAVLGQHPAVEETVVVAREDVPGNKRLVAYLVVNQAAAPTIPQLQQFLKQQLPEYMVLNAFVLLNALPLTSNGKVDRRALPAPDTSRPELAGTYVAPRTSVEELLAGIWTDVLGLEKVGIHDNFFELGGDSILSIQIVARANQAGLRLTPKQLFGHQTIAELATVAGTTSVFQAEQGLVTGEVLLTPIQRWFFEQEFAEPHHWNQAMLLEVPPTLDLFLLQRVVQQLLIHHDALRLQFVRSASGWQQVNAFPDEAFSCTSVDLSRVPKAEQTPAIEVAATELQASLNLEFGPIVRVALFELGSNQPNRLLFVIHHLAVDGVSWRILLEDFQTSYQQLSREEAIKLPPKTTSFQNWAQCLSEYAQSPALEQELDYWLDSSRSAVAPLPVDYSTRKEANTVVSACNVSVSLSVEETRALLRDVPQAYNTQINDALLTAVVQTFAQWTRTRCLLVNLEGHGREEILEAVDLSRTVGWFTTIFPVVLELPADAPAEALKSIKEQLRRIPNRGIGYGLLRYLKGDAAITEKLRSLPQAEVSFNYLGQFDQVLSPNSRFQIAKESRGPEHSHLGRRGHLLEVNAIVTGGQLQLDWTYSSNLHQRATIENLAQGFLKALRALIAHCQSPEAGGYTPSDFPLTQMSQNALNTAFTTIEFEEE